jgi:hypothetical protein
MSISDDFHVGLVLHEAPDPGPDDAVIIGDEDANLGHV